MHSATATAGAPSPASPTRLASSASREAPRRAAAPSDGCGTLGMASAAFAAPSASNARGAAPRARSHVVAAPVARRATAEHDDISQGAQHKTRTSRRRSGGSHVTSAGLRSPPPPCAAARHVPRRRTRHVPAQHAATADRGGLLVLSCCTDARDTCPLVASDTSPEAQGSLLHVVRAEQIILATGFHPGAPAPSAAHTTAARVRQPAQCELCVPMELPP